LVPEGNPLGSSNGKGLADPTLPAEVSSAMGPDTQNITASAQTGSSQDVSTYN